MGQLAKLTPRSDKTGVLLQVGFFPLFLRAQKEFWLDFFFVGKIRVSSLVNFFLVVRYYRWNTEYYWMLPKNSKKSIFLDDFTDCFASDKSPKKRRKSSLKRVFTITWSGNCILVFLCYQTLRKIFWKKSHFWKNRKFWDFQNFEISKFQNFRNLKMFKKNSDFFRFFFLKKKNPRKKFGTKNKYILLGIFCVTPCGCLVCRNNMLSKPQASQQVTAWHNVKKSCIVPGK